MLNNSRNAVIGTRILDVDPTSRQVARASQTNLPSHRKSRTTIRDGLEKLSAGHSANCDGMLGVIADTVTELPQAAAMLALGVD